MSLQKNEYTNQNLSQFGIFQLREIARSVGVHLPTTYKKDDLIEKILQVVKGEIKPFVAKNKKGRPPKSFIGYNGSWKKQEIEQNPQNLNSSWERGHWLNTNEQNKDFSLKVSMPESNFFVSSNDLGENEFTEGTVFIEPNNWGTLHIGGISNLVQSEVAIISPNLIEYFGIKTGDHIKATYENKEQSSFVKDIFSINGKQVENLSRTSFQNLNGISTTEILPLWENGELLFTKYLTPIGKGQRVLITGEKSSGKTKLLKDFALELSKNNLHTIFIALDKRPEEKMNLPKEIEYGFSSFDMIPFRQMYLIELAVERAKRLCEMGQDVALVIDDLLSVARAYEYSIINSSENQFNINSIVSLKKLLAVGRNTQNAGSITLVASIGDGKTDEETRLALMVDDLCNCHINLSKQMFLAGCECFVLPTSYTDNSFQLSNKDDTNLAFQIRSECENKNLIEVSKIYEKYFK